MRGKGKNRRSGFPHTGITPAYAGKSSQSVEVFCIIWDHPRLCGEKANSSKGFLYAAGSPPPMRGKVRLSQAAEAPHRITPAYAGKSTTNPKRKRGERDHPRLCGEKQDLYEQLIYEKGSPPPMRGKVASCPLVEENARITPAYAGKRTTYWEMCGKYQDHPRLCGEKHHARTNRTGHVGSPPPMRGKAETRRKTSSPHRITPAYAGKSNQRYQTARWTRDHPRLCGEKFRFLEISPAHEGSPPPMRGKDV